MRRTAPLVSALLLVATGCQSAKHAAPPTTATTPTTAGTANPTPSPVSTVPAGMVVFTATGVRLVNAEEADNGLRVLIESAAPDVAVAVTGLPTPNRVVTICPAAALDHHVAAPGCVTPESGVTVRIAHGTAYAGIEVALVGTVGTGPAANAITVGTITVSYAATTRQVRLRLPPLQQGEAGGTPVFHLSPAGPGTYSAMATWTPMATTTGEAEMVLAIGPATVSRAEGGPTLSVTGNLSPAAEADVRFRNTGSVTLSAPTLTVLFP